MQRYIVEKQGGYVIAKGNDLSELIEHVYLNQIHDIDQSFSTITKVEKIIISIWINYLAFTMLLVNTPKL